MTIGQLKPRAKFVFNGLDFTVRRNEKLGDGNCRVHVSYEGYHGSVTLPAARRCRDVAEPVKFRKRKKKPVKQ